MELSRIDELINKCNRCDDMVEHFPKNTTVALGKSNKILIIGEAPANNGWRQSGIAWYDENHKLIPSGVVLQRLLNLINLSLDDTCFLEAIKCYPKERKYLIKCKDNCRDYLISQINIINPSIILSLGDMATKAILNIRYSKFSEVVGKTFEIDGYIVIPIYHPSPISPLSYEGNKKIFENIISDAI